MDFNDINRDDSHIYNTKKISSLHIHSDIYTGAYLREIQAQSALLSPVIQAQTHILVATRSGQVGSDRKTTALIYISIQIKVIKYVRCMKITSRRERLK